MVTKVIQGRSVKNVFLEISQNSCEFCEISKNAFSYRTSSLTASVCLMKWRKVGVKFYKRNQERYFNDEKKSCLVLNELNT